MILARVAGAWLAGLAATAMLEERAPIAAAVLYVVTLAGVWFRRVNLAEAFVLPLLFIAAGYLHDRSRPQIGPESVAAYAGLDRAVIEGVVVDEPEHRAGSQRLRVRAEAAIARTDRRTVSGDLLVITSPLRDYSAGDRLELEGRVRLPPSSGDFDYRAYLLRRGIVAESYYPYIERLESDQLPWPKRLILAARRAAARRLRENLDPVEAGLAQGVLIGGAGVVPKGVVQDLRATNLSHLVVVSGYNVTLVGGLGVAASAWLVGRRRALLLGILLAWGYAAIAGLSPPVARAGVMVTLALTAGWLGRPGSASTALALAAALMTAVNPQLIHDVSFQLSFAATLGLVVIARPLSEATMSAERRRGVVGAVVETMSVTVAAMLATLPIQLHHFDRLSLVGLPANLLVVPAFPLMVAASALAIALPVLHTGLAESLAPLLSLPFRWFALVARALGELPGASVPSGRYAPLVVLAAYAAFGLAVLGWRSRSRLTGRLPAVRAPRWMEPAVFAGMGVITLALWVTVLWPVDREFEIAVLDAGDGQAVLVRDRAGRTVLIDGGADGGRLLEELEAVLPSGTGRIDAVFVTSWGPRRALRGRLGDPAAGSSVHRDRP